MFAEINLIRYIVALVKKIRALLRKKKITDIEMGVVKNE